MQSGRGTRILRRLAQAAGVFFLLIVVAAGVSFLSNRSLPTRSQTVENLSAQEKLYVAEALQLKSTVGESIWPAWAQAKIPLVIYNEKNGFLVNESSLPPNAESVAGDSFEARPYFRVLPPKSGAFTECIGDQWAATIGTKEWMCIHSVREMRGQVPSLLRPIVPYRLLIRFFGMNSSDLHITALLHETVHAYQAQAAHEHFNRAMGAYGASDRYPWEDRDLRSAWKTELEILANAVEAKSSSGAADLARQFLDRRHWRREKSGLDAAMVNFEVQMEWLEGLGKYVELAIWQKASTTPSRKPLPELAADAEFKNYTEFPRRWSGELMTMKMQASQSGDIRFYYTGMAQAFLLDQLMPAWKGRILDASATLEDLLAEAVKRH